ncbi:MAG: hypothetical protein ACJA1U_000976 [Bermanella sp.]|jgi:hypothetical protein
MNNKNKGSNMLRIATIVSILFLTACATSTGYHPDTHFSGVKYSDSRVKDVYLFYPGTPIPGEFEQLGLVTATGDQGSSNQDVLSHLKVKALKSGADAIIAVDRRIEPRSAGLIFDDEKEHYNAISYQGTAIRFNDIDALPDHIKVQMNAPDYHAQRVVRNDSDSRSNSIMFELFLSLALGVAYLVSL